MNPDFLSSVRIEDLPQDLQQVASIAGLEATLSLVELFRGTSISVPKTALYEAARRWILERYDGANAHQVARDCGISTSLLFKILRDAGRNGKRGRQGVR